MGNIKSKRPVSGIFQRKRSQSPQTDKAIASKGTASNKTPTSCGTSKSNRPFTAEEAPYVLPADLSEVDRLTQQHYMFRALLGSLHLAPFRKKLNKALDVGTGTGIWCMEMAEKHTDCQIVGVDIATIQPSTVVPSNCTFQVVNALEGLPEFQDNTFDFVFQRAMLGSYQDEQWPVQVAMYKRLCRPGGTVEMMEFDGHLKGFGEHGKRLNDLTEKMCLARGMNTYNAIRGKEYLEKEGFTDVHEVIKRLNFGSRHGNMGTLAVQDFEDLYKGLGVLMVQFNFIGEEELKQLIIDWKAEVEMEENETYIDLYVMYGTKAGEEEESVEAAPLADPVPPPSSSSN
ncbi:S-adenosyl-L-methionine-dependent methyltransferase [Piptocephalis cylindrospora]|uniref:S-adenosyl-L-methionine-dependent methyltransferase n=1 Tax=Piptocephalis cylindrospora TaxID=1907219 RepID=A0A4P9Y5M8_9FUNG|nr:S-adenosyl-L-methionine-dependent methyltransferase [Piptocephalis cylindrospora]|eukprot:RKP14287.1 S-adenosyl-L-methionine-dependent methyltransferase [Piptocephalis cylindrospora]